MKNKDLSLMAENKGKVLFYPFIPKSSLKIVKKTLSTRWIGEGPMVKKFENKFKKKFLYNRNCISTGSGTDALHLSYLLAGIRKGDEVITTVFTCTATNIPLLYIGAKIKFADINPITMNISIESIKKLITPKTKAIVCVHYGGLPCDMDELIKIGKKYGIKIIDDAAQALGAKYSNEYIGNITDFSCFSFQAIKHITTGDGGMLTFKNKKIIEKAKRLRWFGISREQKQKGIWENDIKEIGFKYQMTDLGACVGLAGLKDFSKMINHRRKIYNYYLQNLSKNKKITCVHDYDKKKYHGAWLFSILVNNKDYLQKKLRQNRIETNQVHFRNDKYSIFKKYAKNKKFPNMDSIQYKYLVLPIHNKLSLHEVKYICDKINKYT